MSSKNKNASQGAEPKGPALEPATPEGPTPDAQATEPPAAEPPAPPKAPTNDESAAAQNAARVKAALEQKAADAASREQQAKAEATRFQVQAAGLQQALNERDAEIEALKTENRRLDNALRKSAVANVADVPHGALQLGRSVTVVCQITGKSVPAVQGDVLLGVTTKDKRKLQDQLTEVQRTVGPSVTVRAVDEQQLEECRQFAVR